MVKDYFTVKEVAEIFNIYEVSAEELLNGIIEFEPEELFVLAKAAGVSVEQLVR